MPDRSLKSLILLLAVLALAPGCKDDDPVAAAPVLDRAPAFSLPDVNPTSASFDQEVSPRDYLQKVSAWYFGHAT
jgi:hypothetical protein